MRTLAFLGVLAVVGLAVFACKLRVSESTTLAQNGGGQTCSFEVTKSRPDEDNVYVELKVGGITVARSLSYYAEGYARKNQHDFLHNVSVAANALKQAGICNF